MYKAYKSKQEVIGQINFNPVTKNISNVLRNQYQVTIENNNIKVTKDHHSITMPIDEVYRLMVTEQFTNQLFYKEFERR